VRSDWFYRQNLRRLAGSSCKRQLYSCFFPSAYRSSTVVICILAEYTSTSGTLRRISRGTCRRYASKVEGLRNIFSEFGLIRFRVAVECRWLQQLSRIPEVTEVPPFSPEANGILDRLATEFSVQDALDVKKVPPPPPPLSPDLLTKLQSKISGEAWEGRLANLSHGDSDGARGAVLS
jgi:hypothetical protein